MVHRLVRFGTDPVWRSPVHETLTEVDTVRGDVGGAKTYLYLSITPVCQAEDEFWTYVKMDHTSNLCVAPSNILFA